MREIESPKADIGADVEKNAGLGVAAHERPFLSIIQMGMKPQAVVDILSGIELHFGAKHIHNAAGITKRKMDRSLNPVRYRTYISDIGSYPPYSTKEYFQRNSPFACILLTTTKAATWKAYVTVPDAAKPSSPNCHTKTSPIDSLTSTAPIATAAMIA